MSLIFNPKLKELADQFQKGVLSIEEMQEQLDLAKERQSKLEELKLAEESNSKSKLENSLANFDMKLKQQFNGRTPFQSRYNEERDCIELYLLPDKVVARFGRDGQGMPFKSLAGEISEMSKKEDTDLSTLKHRVYVILEECFK